MKINPYLNFDGDAEVAFNFYRSVFGGEFHVLQRFAEVPGMDNLSDSDKLRVMHVALPIGFENTLMGSDVLQSWGQKHVVGTNVSISIYPDSEAEAERIFSMLSAGGRVTQPLEKAFWGDYFGMLTDKYGVHWMINYELPK